MPDSLEERLNDAAKHQAVLKNRAKWIYAMSSFLTTNDHIRLAIALFRESTAANREAARLFELYNSLNSPSAREAQAKKRLYKAIESYTRTTQTINALVAADKKRQAQKAMRHGRRNRSRIIWIIVIICAAVYIIVRYAL